LFVIPAQRIVQDHCPLTMCESSDRRDLLDRREELSQAESAADLNCSAIDREDYVGQSDQCDFPKLHAHLFRHEIDTVEVCGSSPHGPTIFFSELASTTFLGQAPIGSNKDAVRNYRGHFLIFLR